MTRIAFVLLFLTGFGLTTHAGDGVQSRQQFAAAMDKLKEEMPEADALAILGKPDDVRTHNDPGGISTTDTREIWRYGTSGHLTTATLGQVYINQKGQVQYIDGKGEAIAQGLIEEKELRRLIEILDDVPSYNSGSHYNPRKVIRAVNELQPLGKDKALAVIEEYLRVSSYWHDSGRDGTFLVMRTLFDVPADPGHMPEMYVGAPQPEPPADKKLLPRYPIALEGDIPFLVTEGYSLAGLAEPPKRHLEYFRAHGQIRAAPLTPSTKPWEALETFIKSPRWFFNQKEGFARDESGRMLLSDQVLRLLDSVFRTEADRSGDLLPWGDKLADDCRKRIIDASSAKPLKWDAKNNRFTFEDGKCLPDEKPVLYRRKIWNPQLAGRAITIKFERSDGRYVAMWASENYKADTKRPILLFKVVDAVEKETVIHEFDIGDAREDVKPGEWRMETAAGGSGSWSTMTIVKLKEGTRIQAQVTVDG